MERIIGICVGLIIRENGNAVVRKIQQSGFQTTFYFHYTEKQPVKPFNFAL